MNLRFLIFMCIVGTIVSQAVDNNSIFFRRRNTFNIFQALQRDARFSTYVSLLKAAKGAHNSSSSSNREILRPVGDQQRYLNDFPSARQAPTSLPEGVLYENPILRVIPDLPFADLLEQAGPEAKGWVVGAPSNAGFATLPTGYVEHLLKKESLYLLRAFLALTIAPMRNVSTVTSTTLRASSLFPTGSFAINLQTNELTRANNGVIYRFDSTLSFPAIFLPLSMRQTLTNLASESILPLPPPALDTTQPRQNIFVLSQRLQLPTIGKYNLFFDLFFGSGYAGFLFERFPAATIFVPTNDAIMKYLHAALLEDPSPINNNQGLTDLLRSHVVPRPLLFKDVIGNSTLETRAPNVNLNTRRLPNGTYELFIRNSPYHAARFIATDIITTQGVVHFIDTPLMNQNGLLDTYSLLTQRAVDTQFGVQNFSTFSTLLNLFPRYLGVLQNKLLAQPQRDYPTCVASSYPPHTIFVPLNSAFEALPSGFVDFVLRNTPVLFEILEYHIARGSLSMTALKSNITAPTILDGYSIQTRTDISQKTYINPTTEPTFNNALLDAHLYGRFGQVYFINKVLLPPHIAPLDLENVLIREGYTSFHAMLTEFGLISLLRQKGKGLYTVFALSNGYVTQLRNVLHLGRVPANVTTAVLAGFLTSPAVTTSQLTASVTTLPLPIAPGTVIPLRNATSPFVTGAISLFYDRTPFFQRDLIASNGYVNLLDRPVPDFNDIFGHAAFQLALTKMNFRLTK